MNIVLNGEPRSFRVQGTIADLLAELSLDARYLAVEVNRAVIPRARHAAYELQAEDVVEIVTLVGGG